MNSCTTTLDPRLSPHCLQSIQNAKRICWQASRDHIHTDQYSGETLTSTEVDRRTIQQPRLLYQ